MGTPDKHKDVSVDDILAELKQKGGSGSKANDLAVDNLLSEMGLRDKSVPKRDFTAVSRKPADTGENKKSKEVFEKAKPAAEPKQQPQPAPEKQDTGLFDAPKKDKQPKPGDVTITSWNDGTPRLGKAAAMENRDPDKFTSDSELMSWYSSDQDLLLSKKERKKAEREEKKRLKEERKRTGNIVVEQDIQYTEIQETDFESPASRRKEKSGSGSIMTESAFDSSRTGSWDENEYGMEESAFDSPKKTDTRKLDLGATGRIDTQPKPAEKPSTQRFDIDEPEPEHEKIPTAAFTQEFESDIEQESKSNDNTTKNLFVDEMVDDKFRAFFSETVVVDRADIDQQAKPKGRRKNKKNRTSLITGQMSAMIEHEEEYEEDDFEDYNRPQDAAQIEGDIAALRKTMTRRTVVSLVLALLMGWLSLAFINVLPVPAFVDPVSSPIPFALTYMVLVLAAVIINFTTISAGLIGLVGQATSDTPPALAGVAGLLQGVVLLMQAFINDGLPLPRATLFGAVMALVLAFNTFGKRIRTGAILDNFRIASAGIDHSAAYVLDGSQDLAYHITRGLGEEDPVLLVSRPTALVKGFLRQSFSPRRVDSNGRIMGWVLLGVSLVSAVVTYVVTGELLLALSGMAAVMCIGAPFSSTLVSAVPSALLQQSTSKVGAVVPGWSAIEDLGYVNVVQAGARDIFPPSSVSLKGIKTFRKERIDYAILYAASVLIEGCDTMRDIFLGVIQNKNDMLYKVENIAMEPGRGFSAWVENSRVVIGTREMMQRHDIELPDIEIEIKYTSEGYYPVYLAVSGKLFAMFIMSYKPDPEVKNTLEGLVRSGVSMLVTSDDMNVTGEMIETVYGLPQGVIKVLGRRELELMEPLTAYLPESDGVMTHLGTFTSFIGGMRAAAGCAASERMSGIVQLASVLLACLVCVLMMFGGSLANLSALIILLYQTAWTVLVCALPFTRRY